LTLSDKTHFGGGREQAMAIVRRRERVLGALAEGYSEREFMEKIRRLASSESSPSFSRTIRSPPTHPSP